MNKCIICNYNENIIVKSTFNFVSSDIKKVNYHSDFFICKNCGCVQKNINKTYIKNTHNIYKNYIGFSKYNEIDQKKKFKGVNSSRCNLLFKKFLNKKKYKDILDYGSSNGAMLMPFINSNKKLYSTDLKNNLDNKILKAKNFKNFYNINNFTKSKKKYDLITMIHVLEHLQKPKEVLSNMVKKLKKSGVLFIQIPNFILNPYDLSVYDHTIHFDKSSLVKLAEESNLEIIEIDEKFMNGEFSILLKIRTKKNTYKITNLSIIKKINIFKQFKKNISQINKMKNLSILGTSISSLCIKHNYNGEIISFYDEDLSKIGKNYEGKKIKQMIKDERKNLFLPFYDKKLYSIKNRLKKNYNYKLICWD